MSFGKVFFPGGVQVRVIGMWISGLMLVAGVALAQPTPQKIAGEIVAVEGSTLRLSSAGQPVTVVLSDKARISARTPATLSNITSGSFVGTTAVPQADGTLLASEVHIFSESMRGTGEGHRPMTSPPGATMTNATVNAVTSEAARNTTTNATVSGVGAAPQGRTLKLAYNGGEKTVVVPADALVFGTDAGTRDMLVPGAHVVVYATPQTGGMLTADRVSVGRNGYVPQM